MFHTFATLILIAGVQQVPARDRPPIDIGPYIIFFDSGSAAILRGSAPILDNAATALAYAEREDPVFADGVYLIAGHSDRVGPASENRRLSCARARATRAYLVAKGIAPERLIAVGYGEDQLLEQTPDGVPQLLNRRVEIHFMDPGSAAATTGGDIRC